MLPIITIFELVLGYGHSGPSTVQVWIVPGTLNDRAEGAALSDSHITEYLRKRGVLMGTYSAGADTDTATEEIKRKFERSGFKVAVDFGASD